MNRKKTSKLKKEAAQVASKTHLYDQTETWCRGDFATPPWSPEKIQDFQKRLDSAFEAPNGIVLVWSGDRSYGDVFLNEKGEPERKPVLLFAEHKIEGTNDYCYVTCPRWVLMETLHISQYEDSWEAASMLPDKEGVLRRIRPETPPKNMYKHIHTIAEHDQTIVLGETPKCCQSMLDQKRICYGRYREPDHRDIAFVGRMRAQLNRKGISQRNDTKRDANVLEQTSLATKHFIQHAQQQQAIRVKEMMLANSEAFFGDLPKRLGSTMSYKEMEKVVKEGLDQQMEERFG